MTNKHPIIVVKDPSRFEYNEFFNTVLDDLRERRPGLQLIDILICQPIKNSNHLNVILSNTYNKLRNKVTKLGWDHTFEIDILFNKLNYRDVIEYWDEVIYASGEGSAIPDELSKLQTQEVSVKSNKQVLIEDGDDFQRFQQYPVAALGGTFDHLHDGHKILLSMAIYVASQKIIIGITGPKLLVNKKYAEVLESFELRQFKVVSYLKKLLNQGVKFEIYQINDVCGPTGYVKDISSLVVSNESSRGGDFVNKTREEKGYPRLEIIVIRVIGDENSTEENNWQGKLSSTDIRKLEFAKLHK